MSTEELLLQECKNQLEYLNQKFTATGTTNSLLTKLDAYFSAKERWKGIEKRERILPTTTPAANQEKEIVWEEDKSCRVHIASVGDYKLFAFPDFAWGLDQYGITVICKPPFSTPNLPSAKAAAEKAYRGHVKPTP